jgi:hypothetical protein
MKEENQVVGFDAVKATAQTVLASVKEMVVTTEVEAQAATLKRDEISKVLKLVEARRVDLVKPIDDSKKVIQAEAKGVSDPLEKAKADLFSKVSKWQTEQRMIAEAAARKEREEAEARLAATMADDEATIEDVERVEAHVELAAKPVKMAKSLAPMKTRETWKAEVVDIKALAQHAIATNQLWLIMANESEIGKRVRSPENRMTECPGLNIYSEVGAG